MTVSSIGKQDLRLTFHAAMHIPFRCPFCRSTLSTVLCIKEQYITIQYSALHNCIVQYSVVQYNTKLPCNVHHCTTVQLSALYDKVQDKFIFNSGGVSSIFEMLDSLAEWRHLQIKDKTPPKLEISKGSTLCKVTIKTRWHTQPRTHAPMAFLYLRETKVGVVKKEKEEGKDKKSPSVDQCYCKGHG